MLADVYEVEGKKNHTFGAAVLAILGKRHQITLVSILYTEMWLSAISYTIAG
jgi:hypothetical protein